MASISKRKKLQLILNKEDRISSLPDSILVHILSFLPAIYTVETSILSTRWKHLWASVPNLDFDYDLHQDLKRFRASVTNLDFNDDLHEDPSVSDFMNIVDQVLFNHESTCLQKFRFNCSLDTEDLPRIHPWICYAIKCGIKELDIAVHLEHLDKDSCRLSFPLSLFTCPTLVTLKLGSYISFRVPNLVHFQSLKVLHLSMCAMDDLTQNIFYNCPVLEDLVIEGLFSGDEKFIIDVSVASLKSFKFYICETYSAPGTDIGNQIVLNAPILEYLTLKEDQFPNYLAKNLTSLVKADVNVGYFCKTELTKQHAHRLLVLLREIRNVKYLLLGDRTTRALDYAEDINLPLFPNLIRLTLRLCVCNRHGWKHLLELLNSTPNMRYLRFVKSKCFQITEDNASKDINFVEQKVVPRCLSMCLQKIGIIGFRGMSDELKLIKYLLRNSKVLQKMEINTCNLEVKQERDFLEKLLQFPRGSITCQIILSQKRINNH